ncbi:hypothetical protein JAAARDRAFT_41895 [Jaapia argillacea MUCL 33604]|uniref:NmrA-like domain-containing protein n=1 Tax=Jaapia argillacea MUCL 33604 TaxID=933084 RepID=A0A067PHS2_9AGAM|nr:hypothetical protein JAAARDRAFT_41895 [Jaapia argillacea MUCL 33604]
MTILISSAGGRTSGYVIQALLSNEGGQVPISPDQLKLLVHSEKSIASLKSSFPSLPDASFVIGDFLEYSTLRRALKGVDVAFHNGPVFHPNETAMGINMINAALEAGVKHFVFCSVLYPYLSKLLNHKAKLGVEEYLTESGLNFTILQPTSFMQNIDVARVVATGKMPCGFNVDVLQGFLDLTDLGIVTRDILLDPTPHAYASYQPVGQNCTNSEITQIIRTGSKKDNIEAFTAPREETLQGFRQRGVVGPVLADYSVDGLERMLFYYDKRGIPGSSNTLRWLLGREPTSWAERVRRDLELQ